jgi:hypothetical protein
VLRGKYGLSIASSPCDWSMSDRIVTPADGVQQIASWTPHTLWPVPDANEDTVLLLWAHPKKGDDDMDHLFFETLFRYTDEAHNGAWLDPLQMFLLKCVHISCWSS